MKVQLSKAVVVFFVISIAVLGFLAINNYFRDSIKDYGKWFLVGQTVLTGGDIYAPRGDGTFQFMYPPTAAVLFAIPSYFGELPLIIVLVMLYSVAWVASSLLSVFLATGTAARAQPILYLLPGACSLPYVTDNFLLGQPNLLLLAFMLGAFACLRSGREWSAGALVALASAIKAFPVLAIGYLVYRRHWRATLSTLVFLVLLLVVLPSPLRGLEGNLEDLNTWTRGMFRYDNQSISQREQRGFSWANHSLIAVTHRLLRPVNAHRKQDQELFVNVADVDFKYVTMVVVLVGTALCAFYIFCMPSYRQRTNASDALEYAMLLLLILIFTPLAFTYFFVWLLYPLVVALRLVLKARPGPLQRIAGWTWFFASVIFLCFTFPLPAFRPVQAAGSTLVSCLLLLVGIGWNLRAETRKAAKPNFSPEAKIYT
ncbi:MAG TPA: glycosyltransferase family 87 protein [Candidatus Polarisedimenticolaceae bacterium]|nr:glycosyltransferase family 87 protein [Candidatus Polarisedimenticolaceae bacterium]